MKTDFPRDGLDELKPPVKPSRALAGLLAFYLLALLLNAPALEKELSLLEYGTRRDWALTLISPAVKASSALRLDQPRCYLEKWLGEYLQDEKNNF